jgi:DNA sulfur modification protein DndD
LKAIQVEQAKKDATHKRLGAIEAEIQRTEDIRQKIDTLIKELETRLVKDSINTHRIKRARQAQRTFEDYKEKLKENKRDQIEQSVNSCFSSLMTSHNLVAQVKIDNDFALSYLDSTGQEIGMANLSAGMKQLAAQALLWALSDVTNRDIPVIVDTPLARIDRVNQENLLTKYYPKAGKQTIILPTDSEIDKEKYRIIHPHINTEFTLDNSKSGESTEIRANTKMYNLRAMS